MRTWLLIFMFTILSFLIILPSTVNWTLTDHLILRKQCLIVSYVLWILMLFAKIFWALSSSARILQISIRFAVDMMTSSPQLWTNMLLWSPRRSLYDQIHLGILMTLAWKNLLDDVSKDAGVILSSQNIAWHVAQCKLMKSLVLNAKTKYY